MDRDAANQVGVDLGQISATLRPLMAGRTATRWEDPTGEERDVVMQVAPEQRQSVDDIASMPVPTANRTPNGTADSAPQLHRPHYVERGPAQIDRKNLERFVAITGSNAPGVSISEASATLRDRLGTLRLPPGYSINLVGQTQLQETGGYVLETLSLAVILIFLILASQFESLTQPFAIMLSLPLSLVGVLLALLVTGTTLNIMSMIGIIMLMGLVTKNAILLIDNANERRRAGAERCS